MQLFELVSPKLFRPLAGPNRAYYAELLLLLWEECRHTADYSLSRAEAVSRAEDYFAAVAKPLALDADGAGDEDEQPTRDPHLLALGFLLRLRRTGWLEEQPGSYEEEPTLAFVPEVTPLLEALEASTFCTPISLGGFPQIAGMNISIDATKKYDPQTTPYPSGSGKATYYGPASINRVTINSVNGKAFDPNKTYAVVTNNFCAAGGDTYYAFAAASSQFDTGLPLDEVLMDYITTELKGVVGEQYAQPQGRITITLPAEEPTTPTKPESPKTADNGVVVYGLVAVMAAGAVVVMTSKKRKAI